MKKRAKLLANFLGVTKELTAEYIELAEITDDELAQIGRIVGRQDRKKIAQAMAAKGHSTREIAEFTGWDYSTIARDLQKVRGVADATKSVANATAEPSTSPSTPSTTTRALKDERDAAVAAAAEAEGVTPEPTEKYRIIYADPPWSYDTEMPPRGLEPSAYYPVMELNAICALPVKDWVEDNAVLFLWATAPVMEEALQVVQAWGFGYKAQFIWDKIKHNMGHYNSVRHELLLICTRGSCQPDKQQLFDSVQSIERGKHSEKPVEFYDIIETLYTHGRKLEIFARGRREGWDVYGHVAQLTEAAE